MTAPARALTVLATVGAAIRPLLPFSAGLAVAVGAACLAPGLGARGGPLHTEVTTTWAVACIFLIQGLQLPLREVRQGFAAWPVHLFCQVWMFAVYPLLAWAVVAVAGPALTPAERIGLLFVGMLPTTVATNAAFSARAGGNGAVSLFNIVLGNLLGVFISPAWLALLLARGAGASIDCWPLLRSLGLQLILPFIVGQLLRPRLTGWVGRHRLALRETASVMIFFIVYTAICNLLAGGTGGPGSTAGRPAGAGGIAAVATATLALLAVGKALCWSALRALGWSHDLQVAAFFAASQKTLAAGLPIAGAVYAAAGSTAELPPLALLALPLVIFHVGQLVIGALLVPVLGSLRAARPGA